ncbi:MAG: hypothetical protein PHY70_06035 [Methanocellales archaeon]|nr:hypothetical protein [Methanocellales archaeon]
MPILGVLSAPGVEALINIILVVILTITLAFTAYYAHQASKQAEQASKQTDIMRKEGKRRYIVELMKCIIAPLIDDLKREIKSIEKREYEWMHEGSFGERNLSARNIKKLVVKPEILLNDLKRDFPDLNRKIEDHDNRCQILQEKLKSLDESIYTPAFEKECHERTTEYSKKHLKPDPKFLLTPDIESSPIAFVGYIIDNRVKLFPGDKFHDFWEEYGAEFLQIRNREDIKAKIDEIGRIADGLKLISQELKKDLEKLRDSYRQEYDIPIGEFDESLSLMYIGEED